MFVCFNCKEPEGLDAVIFRRSQFHAVKLSPKTSNMIYRAVTNPGQLNNKHLQFCKHSVSPKTSKNPLKFSLMRVYDALKKQPEPLRP